MPFADRGEASAKFAAFNAAQMAKRAAEVDAEDRRFEAKERERQKAEAKRAAQAKKNRERRERLLAMGISEEDMRGIGLFEDEDDDPSWCTQAREWWMASGLRRYLCKKINSCRPKARVAPPPPADARYLKGGATRHKCGHSGCRATKVLLRGDRRPVLQEEGEKRRGPSEGGRKWRRTECGREQADDLESAIRLYPGYREGSGRFSASMGCEVLRGTTRQGEDPQPLSQKRTQETQSCWLKQESDAKMEGGSLRRQRHY